ncbi:Fur family transcriptional regulator [Lacisediminihabitans changchengi]|uniref:Transcriptional repressor n=1 Tax=Lacisediminihabitans changchengi TaxID=2787634 RepID=A0A934W115_9MICO|nr:Fur family transcriptional regulator [Lacisediminihabitans changchengi]MBK4346413.1 transcriptional repressor [Lacisediminihabitans changchengi]
MQSTSHHDLREAGLRVTDGRVALLRSIEFAPHSNADTLWRMMRAQVPRISVQSVHNVLADLTAAGLLRRIEPAGSAALYERRIGDNHHHVVCSSCGAVADIDCVHGDAPCLTPGDAAGYTIQQAEVTFWGTCADCQKLTEREPLKKETT